MYTRNEESAPGSVANNSPLDRYSKTDRQHIGAECLQVALDGARRGWSMLPIAFGAKKPAVKWTNFLTAPANEDLINHWWTKTPERGVGVVVGAVSGNLVAIDVDGPEAAAEWKRITGGEVFQTWSYWTSKPKGKFRVLFRSDDAVESVDLLKGGKGVGELAVMASRINPESGDVENHLQVVLPPSVHPQGHQYEWQEGFAPSDLPDGPMLLPDWLAERFRATKAPKSAPAPALAPTPALTSPPNSPPNDDDRPGDRLNQEHPAPLFQRLGLTYLRTDARQECWHRPGSVNEVAAGAQLGADGKWNIQIYSTSLDVPPESYDPFGLLACLDHGGDRGAAAKAIKKTMTGPNPFEGVVIDPSVCPVDTQPTSMLEPEVSDADWQPPFGFVRVGDLSLKIERWLVPGLVVGDAAQIISGAPGGAKSSIVRALCCHLASGRGAMARPDGKPAVCVWGVTEDSPRVLTSTAVSEGLTAEETRRIIVTDSLEKRIVDPKLRQDVIRWLRRESVELLIIDPLSKASTTCGFKVNDAEGARGVLDPCAEIAATVPGLSVIVLSHTVKSPDVQGQNRIAGSVQVGAAVRMASIVDPCEGGVVLKQEKTNNQKDMHTWTFKQVALSAEEARTNLQSGGWTFEEEEFEELLLTFKRQEVTWTPRDKDNHIDATTGIITIGAGGLPAPITREQKVLKQNAELEAIKKSILHRLEVAARPIPWSDIVAGAALGTGDRILRKARLDLSESGQVVVKKQPGSNTTIIELAKPIEPLPADLNLA